MEEISRRQAQRSVYAGAVFAVLGCVCGFFGFVWAAMRAPRLSDPGTWPMPAIGLAALGVAVVLGGAAWAVMAMMLKSRWDRDLRRMR